MVKVRLTNGKVQEVAFNDLPKFVRQNFGRIEWVEEEGDGVFEAFLNHYLGHRDLYRRLSES